MVSIANLLMRDGELFFHLHILEAFSPNYQNSKSTPILEVIPETPLPRRENINLKREMKKNNGEGACLKLFNRHLKKSKLSRM
jgi:hypothetical protein